MTEADQSLKAIGTTSFSVKEIQELVTNIEFEALRYEEITLMSSERRRRLAFDILMKLIELDAINKAPE